MFSLVSSLFIHCAKFFFQCHHLPVFFKTHNLNIVQYYCHVPCHLRKEWTLGIKQSLLGCQKRVNQVFFSWPVICWMNVPEWEASKICLYLLLMAKWKMWSTEICCWHFMGQLLSNSGISVPPLHQCNFVDLMICGESYCSHAFKVTNFPQPCFFSFVQHRLIVCFSRVSHFAATDLLLLV